ncbi:ATP-binding cassette domain-containing protein [Streptomyces sp. NPDC094437]|uniref:ATP-binding cassette domain-containing protein n=1 Tax=Streptomyces sp. NPDC094437 TaxID=3366060 RepID=UPI0037FBA777
MQLFNLLLAATVLFISGISIRIIYSRKNSQAIFVRHINGWRYTVTHRFILSVEMATAILLTTRSPFETCLQNQDLEKIAAVSTPLPRPIVHLAELDLSITSGLFAVEFGAAPLALAVFHGRIVREGEPKHGHDKRDSLPLSKSTVVINIENPSKPFGSRILWSEVIFTVSHGEMPALVGPSGSGKSTLLNCLGLFDRPNAGAIRHEGKAHHPIRPTRDSWVPPRNSRLPLPELCLDRERDRCRQSEGFRRTTAFLARRGDRHGYR